MRSKRQRDDSERAELRDILEQLPQATPDSPFEVGPKVKGEQCVSIHTARIKPEHDLHLMELWSFLFRQTKSRLTLKLEIPGFNRSSDMELSCVFNEELLQYPAILYNTVLWSCLIKTLQHHTENFNVMMFAAVLSEALENCNEFDESWLSLSANAAELYRLTQHEAAFQSIFPILAPLLIRNNQLQQFSQLIDERVLKQAVRLVDMAKSPLLLHYAMQTKSTTPQTIDKLYALLDGRPSHLLDDAGNSLMHVCRHAQYLVAGRVDVRDIYRPNAAGDLPIHLAARTANLVKAQYLFRHMIDPEIKNHITGESFSSIVAHVSDAVDSTSKLNLYRKFKLKGVVISAPTVSLVQNGHTCGMYAVDCAARHHRAAKPTLFANVPYLPPRKSDTTPRAADSLRKHNKSKVGEVLSVDALLKLVHLTGNQGLTVDIESYEHFVRSIQIAIRLDFPIILPFNVNNGAPHVGENATHAHWATIIGHYEDGGHDYLLFAQYNRYNQFNARSVLESCFNTKPNYPQCYFVKDPTQIPKWTKHLFPPVVSPGTKVRAVPAMNLTDFFGKIVVVLPPGVNRDEVRLQLLGGHAEHEPEVKRICM